MRELVGLDAQWTATVRDTVTDVVITSSWLEVGATSMTYASTNTIVIYHLGGAQRLNRIRVVKTDAGGAPPANIIINDSFTGGTLGTWTEFDPTSVMTVTLNSPGVTMAQGANYSASVFGIRYNTVLGTTINSYKIRATFRLTMTADTDYVIELERTYSGSGNATYVARAWAVSAPGTIVSTPTYTSTSAPEQAYYATTKWSINNFSHTNKVTNCTVELL
jgi:hypothetical protein